MTKKEELSKLHKETYIHILLKSIEDRTKEENDFYLWYSQKHIEEVDRIKTYLKNKGLLSNK